MALSDEIRAMVGVLSTAEICPGNTRTLSLQLATSNTLPSCQSLTAPGCAVGTDFSAFLASRETGTSAQSLEMGEMPEFDLSGGADMANDDFDDDDVCLQRSISIRQNTPPARDCCRLTFECHWNARTTMPAGTKAPGLSS